MILNQLEYQIIKNQVQKFQVALFQFDCDMNIPTPIRERSGLQVFYQDEIERMRNGLISLISRLSQQINDYDNIEEEDWGGNGDY